MGAGRIQPGETGRTRAQGLHAQVHWGWLVASCLVALLVFDRVSPVLPQVPPGPVSGASRPRHCQARLPSGDCWIGVTQTLQHVSLSVRRVQPGDIAPVRAISIPWHLPTLLLRHVSPRLPRSFIFLHERFYIRPRAPASSDPTELIGCAAEACTASAYAEGPVQAQTEPGRAMPYPVRPSR